MLQMHYLLEMTMQETNQHLHISKEARNFPRVTNVRVDTPMN